MKSDQMFEQKLKAFLTGLRGKKYTPMFWDVLKYELKGRTYNIQIHELRKGEHCLRVYRNTDGTWSLMPNWFKTAEQNHKRAMSTNYETFDDIPVDIQEKLSVLLLHEAGGDWLSGIGKRVDTGVFWLEE